MLSVPLSLLRAISGTTISDSGSGCVSVDEADARVELGPVREHRLAVLDGPAGDPDAVGERRVGEHLVRVLAQGIDRLQLAGCLVRLVERDVVVRDQLADRVGDPVQEVVERLLREHLVEDVRELAVRLDQGSRAARGAAIRSSSAVSGWGITTSPIQSAGAARLLSRKASGRQTASMSGRIVVGIDGTEDSVPALRWAVAEGELAWRRGRGASTRGPTCRSRPRRTPGSSRSRGRSRTRCSTRASTPRSRSRSEQLDVGARPGPSRQGRRSCRASPPRRSSPPRKEPTCSWSATAGAASLTQTLLGSTSAKVSDRAPCPVVVVRSTGGD